MKLMMTMKPSHLLVDADIMVFQFACGNQQVFEWGDGVTSEVVDLDSAKRELDLFIERLLEKTETSQALFCFSSQPSFRYSVLPTYKHNRKDREKPKLLEDLKLYVREKYNVKTKPQLEADDVIGILATISPGKYIITTLDKDLNQIPGIHYDWRKDEYDDVSLERANKFFWRQILTGDSTDGYSGCPGIGSKKAEHLLEGINTEQEAWQVIVETYASKGLTEEDALQQARVARILRKEDYNYKKNEPILWTPSS